MTGILLQRMLEELPASSLPPNWQDFDLQTFSRTKSLWDYQQQALQFTLKALWKYYNDPDLSVDQRKSAFYAWYKDFGLEADLDIPLDTSTAAKRRLTRLLESYYTKEEEPVGARHALPSSKLPYQQFINRMSFWMATGSGKTLVLIKTIELLHILMQRGEIPKHDILVLAHRDDLLEQLHTHVQDFNTTASPYIRLEELCDYSEIKHASPSLFSATERTVFYYRSDNLSDEQKEKIIDFRSYDNNGEWYVLLDEAHKGDKEDSKRQHIYSILSRNGFLFNFSATFTDPRDIICTAFNFNLSEYIRKGFGKHIYIFQQETDSFKRKQDFSADEKQKIVLKALMMLTLIRNFETKVRAINPVLYHRPLLMTLVNSVNTKDADLKLFFRELVRIGSGKLDENLWKAAREELLKEMSTQPAYIYERDVKVCLDLSTLEEMTPSHVIKQIFNADTFGDIEVLIRPSDHKELAFKLKTSEEAFALIRIGDVSDWIIKELSGYEINQHFNDEGFFEKLNHPSSDINILLGSRSFYEGWDSNRPNVIMYINIGTGTDAKKFILQSVGRGARIEPFKGQRKRFSFLHTSGSLSEQQENTFQQVKHDILPLESEFIFGTNRDALELVINELDQEDKLTGSSLVSLTLNEQMLEGKQLLIPVYKVGDFLLHQERNQAKFSLSPGNLALLQSYVGWVQDERVLMALHNVNPDQVRALKAGLKTPDLRFRTDGITYRNLSVLMSQSLRYLSLHGKEFENFKELEEEINHFKHIRVSLQNVQFALFEKQLQQFQEKPKKMEELRAKYNAHQLTLETLMAQTADLGGAQTFTHQGQTLEFKHIQQHYYLPMLISHDEKLDFIRSVIKVPSEVAFITKLEEYLKNSENLFSSFDWWLFSRVDANSDNVTVPYYDPVTNKIANFNPDFIFWLQKGNDYHIIFVDPKGTGRTEYEHKVDGFRRLFEKDGQSIVFNHNGLNVKAHLFLFTDDKAWVADYYRNYWMDSVEQMISSIL